MPTPSGHSTTTELSFPLKLWHIMEREPKVFKWNLEHESFRIIDEDELVNRVLQQHFRTSRFSSFTRNLNIYGFKKIAKGEFAGSYYHPDFKRGGFAAVTQMRRCVRRATDTEPAVKMEGKATRKPPAEASGKSNGKRTKPAPQKSVKAHPVALKVEVPDETTIAAGLPNCMENDHSQFPISSCEGSTFWNDASLCEEDFAMEHELAMPPSPNGLDEGFPNFYAGTSATCCSTPHGLLDHVPDALQNPLPEDEDLSEWKKVLCFTSNNCPDVTPQPQQSSIGANAYCIQLPAGPLGATLECQGDKLLLSKVADPHSPLAHVPIGAQLVNLDGQDTTKMAAGQVAKLDESSCHRNRMVIFALTQCFDTALLAMTPTVPQPRSHCDMGPPKAKCIRDDFDMDTDSNSDSSPRAGSPLCGSNSSSWLQCIVDAM